MEYWVFYKDIFHFNFIFPPSADHSPNTPVSQNPFFQYSIWGEAPNLFLCAQTDTTALIISLIILLVKRINPMTRRRDGSDDGCGLALEVLKDLLRGVDGRIDVFIAVSG